MPDPHTDDLLLDIDPSILDAALESVNRNIKRKPHEKTEVVFDIEMEPEATPAAAHAHPAHAPPPHAHPAAHPPERDVENEPTHLNQKFSAEERQRWLTRQLDQTERIRKLEKELKSTKEERSDLQRQLDETRKTLSERSAEFEITRQRHRKDRDEAERVAEERVVKPLLDIVDNLDRAFAHAAKDPNKVQAGLQMIREQFANQLRRLGAERIAIQQGSLFDPSEQEAILHLPTSTQAPGTVVEEVSAGFRLKGRLLRAARVVVSAGS